MQFDKQTIPLFSITQLVKREDFILMNIGEAGKETDWAFIIDNNVPIQPIYIANKVIVIGSEVISGLAKFMEKQEGKYLRKVQDFPIKVNIIKEYSEEELEKIILYVGK